MGRCRGRIGYGDGDLGPFVKRPVFNWICGPEVRIPATEAMDDIDFGNDIRCVNPDMAMAPTV